ncbi:secretogranin-1 isoform X1 [Silurus asotus]|uniref:Secretogranin-1 isoform X1 n=1 Tax=Silurus asotus TaxID=30991 RepID=A0AAD5A8S8_SILAS|nr:secretogranin-1 isoform X1 [Silurus asotus]
MKLLFLFVATLSVFGGSSQTLLAKTNEEELLPVEQDEKREFNARAQEIINELLKAHEEKHEDIDEERSQEEFPNYNKRHHVFTSKEKREDPDNERSQEEFPQKRHSLLSTKEKRWDEDEERSQEDFPNYEQKRHLFLNSNEKRDDPDYDRSQEDFPTYEQKRHIFFTSKEKRDDPDYDRSQEDFPTYEQKRHIFFTSKEKRDDPDYDRSQEDFPTYEQKRQIFFTSKEKRDDPDYDRSQEEFPSYVYKRYHDKKRGTEKQIWKPHKYHYNQYDDSSNDDIGRLNFQEKRFKTESAKQYWDPVQQYHHKKQHKHDEPSNEEMESEKRVSWTRGTEEGSKDGEEREKRIWKPNYNNHITNLFHKQGKFENENDENFQHLETSTRRSPEEEEEQLIAQELNENKHYYDNQEEQKRHHSDAEEKKQEEKSELRELIKKINEPEEHLLKANEVYDKHNPWINRGYHHPAWYKRNAEVNGDLEELANALRYKLALLSEKQSTEGDKAFPHQRALTPDELKELGKLASAEQRAQMN